MWSLFWWWRNRWGRSLRSGERDASRSLLLIVFSMINSDLRNLALANIRAAERVIRYNQQFLYHFVGQFLRNHDSFSWSKTSCENRKSNPGKYIWCDWDNWTSQVAVDEESWWYISSSRRSRTSRLGREKECIWALSENHQRRARYLTNETPRIH